MKYAFRRLRLSPMFTVAATLTLAITIGATGSVFGVVDGVLLKAFPYRNADRVLTLWESNPVRHEPRATVAAANYFDWAAQAHDLTLTATCCDEGWFTVTWPQEAERIAGLVVTSNYFQVLGLTPILGRPLAPDTSGPHEVVISYGYWKRRFGGAPTVIGQQLTMDNYNDARPTPKHTYTIVGVMPPGLPGNVDMWALIFFEPGENLDHGFRYLKAYVRMAPGTTVQGAQHELETIAQRLAIEYPKTNENWTIAASPLLDSLIGPVQPALIVLLGAACCVLVIGAANLANLFLVRCLAREREIAVRAALGATRDRLISELVTEAALLGLVGGALGVAFAAAGVRALRALAPASLPRVSEVGVDWRIVAFCAVAALVAIVIFGLVPAWRVSRGSLAGALKEGGRGTGSAQHHRLQDGLAVLQIGVALVLLTGAGLLVTSFVHFLQIDPGFRPQGVLTARVSLTTERYPDPARRNVFFAGLLERLTARSGIQSASLSGSLPSSARYFGMEPFVILGDPAPDPQQAPVASSNFVIGDYFRTMGIKLLRGRTLPPTDKTVAVIDELLARRFFADRDPIGHRVTFTGLRDTMEIVGVVASARENGLAADAVPMIYHVAARSGRSIGALVEVRTTGDPAVAASILKETVAGLDPYATVSDIETMNERVLQTIGMTRFSTFLGSLFAVVALVLGIVGIYSVLSYIVDQRRREMAVRLALGASPSRLVGSVVGYAIRLTAAGIVVGSGVAWLLTRTLAALFLGVSPHDPLIFIGAPAVFTIVALLAAIVPSLRATRVSPVAALSAT